MMHCLLQVLSMSEEFRRALYANSAISLDNDIIVPDLIGTTEILSDEHREQLCRHLPARAEGYQWTLVFSTSQHGFSLNSMYRKMAKVESPILLVIEDTEGNVSFLFLNLNKSGRLVLTWYKNAAPESVPWNQYMTVNPVTANIFWRYVSIKLHIAFYMWHISKK